ncbi:MAG: hypothetical protein M3066_10125 [Actinomycetota bacterium]|nr:hypothetical protein [Actinomycetota bacterium]
MSAQGYDDTDMTPEEFDQAVQSGVPADVTNLAARATFLVFEANASIARKGAASGTTWNHRMAPAVQSPRISQPRVPA